MQQYGCNISVLQMSELLRQSMKLEILDKPCITRVHCIYKQTQNTLYKQRYQGRCNKKAIVEHKSISLGIVWMYSNNLICSVCSLHNFNKSETDCDIHWQQRGIPVDHPILVALHCEFTGQVSLYLIQKSFRPHHDFKHSKRKPFSVERAAF